MHSVAAQSRILDLCCNGGGAGMGYALAGFGVVGVDMEAQPDYPFEFVQADALTFPLDGFDWVHASPPCQAFSSITPAWARDRHPDLIDPLRTRLRSALAAGRIKGYTIENVVGAPLRLPVQICGSAFGLGVQRHRLFESSIVLAGTGCSHGAPVIDVYGSQPAEGVEAARQAMGIDWVPWANLVEAVPPAYTEFLGRQILRHIGAGSTAPRVGAPSQPGRPTTGRACGYCSEPLSRPPGGRWPSYCRQACRQAAYRLRLAQGAAS